MKIINIMAAATLLALSMSAQSAEIFFGEDLVPTTSTVNSDAANTAFLSNLVGVGTEDFESFADGTSGPVLLDFGTAGTSTLSGTGAIQTGSSAGRFPTSGTTYWETNENFVIDFSEAIAAFGFFATDIGDFAGQITLDFLSGGSTIFTVDNTVGTSGSTDGSQLFWGIIDVLNPFTRITFGNTNGSDFFGFDDMTIGTIEQVTAVPIPAAAFLFAPALIGFVGLRRKLTSAA